MIIMMFQLRQKQLMKFPVSDLPVDFYDAGKAPSRRYNDLVYLSDRRSHSMDDLRLETSYLALAPHIDDKVGTRLRNQGMGMVRRLARLGDPPAGIVAVRHFDTLAAEEAIKEWYGKVIASGKDASSPIHAPDWITGTDYTGHEFRLYVLE